MRALSVCVCVFRSACVLRVYVDGSPTQWHFKRVVGSEGVLTDMGTDGLCGVQTHIIHLPDFEV